MAKYTWNTSLVPNDVVVKQVYGIVFSDDFKILLRVEDGKYKLTGGKPEKDESYEDTLKREYIEELNVELDNVSYLGYLLVEENDLLYAQVRMVAKIKKINDTCIDPAMGKTYGRELVDCNKVKDYLKYKDDAGNTMIDDAINMIKNIT